MDFMLVDIRDSNWCDRHRVWEVDLDLDEISATPGGVVNLGLTITDRSTTDPFNDMVGGNHTRDFSHLVKINLASRPFSIGAGSPIEYNDSVFPAIEFTQAIQDRSNSLRLVAEKKTVARVYIGTSSGFFDAATMVYLHASQNNIELYDSPLRQWHWSTDSMRGIDRLVVQDTANFVLPTHGGDHTS